MDYIFLYQLYINISIRKNALKGKILNDKPRQLRGKARL